MKAGNKIVRILKNYPIAVLCAIVIVICGAVIFLRGGVAAELTAQEADLNVRIRMIDQNVKNAKNLAAEVEEIKVLVEQVEARLFSRNQRAVNINFFYALEDRLDVRISNIAQLPAGDATYSKGGPRELKLHSTIEYNISLNAHFDEILVFLFELHRVDPFIRVVDFEVAGSNNRASNEGLLEARLRVLVLAEID
jgi:hypothetical protein